MLFEKKENQKKSIVVILILAAFILVLYWPVQHYEFISYDDQLYIYDNFRIQNGISLESIRKTFYDFHTGHWHPLTMMSHMLDWQMFGLRAGGHHWSNVIFHLLNSVMLFVLLRSMTGAVWRSAFVAALFAVHPMNVESVAWIAERKNVLSTFFWILTMLLYVAYVRNPGWKRYVWVCVSFVLGLLSKPMLVTLPFVLLLMDYWPLNRTFFNPAMEAQSPFAGWAGKRKTSFLIAEKIPLFALTALSIYMTIYASEYTQNAQDFASWPFMDRLFNVVFSYVAYIKKMFWPVDLSVFYPFSRTTFSQFSISILVLLAITFFVLLYVKKIPYCFVGWFWFAGTLVPVIGIYQVGLQAMADRYAYVPFIGLFIVIVWGANHLAADKLFLRKIFLTAFALAVFLLASTASHRIGQWTDTETIFQDAVKKDLNNYIAYQALGQEMGKKGRYQEALSFYEKAISANPMCWQAFNNKGLILKIMGRRREASESFQQATKIYPHAAEAYHNLGVLCFEEKKFNEAVRYFSKSIQIKPEFIESYNYLGVALVQNGRVEEGIQYFRRALKISPGDKNAQTNLKIASQLQAKKQDGDY